LDSFGSQDGEHNEIGQADEPADTGFEPMSTSGLSATDLAAVTQLWSTSRDGERDGKP
jgi:mycobactin peptide synthetase MbtE